MSKYSIGIDYGTLSGRAVIIDIDTGNELATAVMNYPHGVMSDQFIDGSPLPQDYALQHPGDYLEVLYTIVSECMTESGVDPKDIIGIGIDFTASTILPVTEDGTPLCFLDKYKNNPHAYVKLWKHHSAQDEADKINTLARKRQEEWLSRYGGTVSSEWLFPKVMEILNDDEELYNDTARFIEAGDWLIWHITGSETHSVCMTGFKALWDKNDGFPSNDFFKELDPRFDNIIGTKISKDVITMSHSAGKVSASFAEKTGLAEGINVSPAIIDAHAAVPALGIRKPGELLMIIGTSTCHILYGDKPSNVNGICGYVKGALDDDLYVYEAGQPCVGDSFDWFIKNCVPASYINESEKLNKNIHEYLRSKAEKLSPGSNGIIAVDWWNGSRTPYDNSSLSGLILGLSTNTKPEEIYRALIEATAYGTKHIIELYEKNGITINTLYAAGGIAEKDSLLMQIYSDVIGKEIKVSGTSQACAYGSALFASVNPEGYKSLSNACSALGKIKEMSYKPNFENAEKYDMLYNEYKSLCSYFASGDNPIMKRLKNI